VRVVTNRRSAGGGSHPSMTVLVAAAVPRQRERTKIREAPIGIHHAAPQQPTRQRNTIRPLISATRALCLAT